MNSTYKNGRINESPIHDIEDLYLNLQTTKAVGKLYNNPTLLQQARACFMCPVPYGMPAEIQNKKLFDELSQGFQAAQESTLSQIPDTNTLQSQMDSENFDYSHKDDRREVRKKFDKKFKSLGGHNLQLKVLEFSQHLEYKHWTEFKKPELLHIAFQSFVTSGEVPQYEYIVRKQKLSKKFSTTRTGVRERKLILKEFLRQAHIKGTYVYPEVSELISQGFWDNPVTAALKAYVQTSFKNMVNYGTDNKVTNWFAIVRNFMKDVLLKVDNFINSWGIHISSTALIAMIIVSAIVALHIGVGLIAARIYGAVILFFRGTDDDSAMKELMELDAEDSPLEEKMDTLISQGLFESVQRTVFCDWPEKITNFEARLGRFSTNYNSIERAMSSILDRVKWTINWCYQKITGRDYFDDFKLQTECKKNTTVIDEIAAVAGDVSETKAKEFIKAYQELQVMKFAVQKTPLGQIVLGTLARHHNTFVGMNSRINHSTRVCPTALHICGFPGQGKSTVVPLIVKAMHALAKRDKLTTKECETYERKPVNEFWDQYNGQFACTRDDDYQLLDPAYRMSAAMEYIEMVNVAPYPLHSAAVEQKGNFFFSSEIIVTTANITGTPISYVPNNLGITDPNAVYRRMHLKFFAKRLDESKKCEGDAILENVVFYKIDDVTFKPDMDTPYEVTQVIKLYYEYYKKQRKVPMVNPILDLSIIDNCTLPVKKTIPKPWHTSTFVPKTKMKSQMDGGEDDGEEDSEEYVAMKTHISSNSSIIPVMKKEDQELLSEQPKEKENLFFFADICPENVIEKGTIFDVTYHRSEQYVRFVHIDIEPFWLSNKYLDMDNLPGETPSETCSMILQRYYALLLGCKYGGQNYELLPEIPLVCATPQELIIMNTFINNGTIGNMESNLLKAPKTHFVSKMYPNSSRHVGKKDVVYYFLHYYPEKNYKSCEQFLQQVFTDCDLYKRNIVDGSEKKMPGNTIIDDGQYFVRVRTGQVGVLLFSFHSEDFWLNNIFELLNIKTSLDGPLTFDQYKNEFLNRRMFVLYNKMDWYSSMYHYARTTSEHVRHPRKCVVGLFEYQVKRQCGILEPIDNRIGYLSSDDKFETTSFRVPGWVRFLFNVAAIAALATVIRMASTAFQSLVGDSQSDDKRLKGKDKNASRRQVVRRLRVPEKGHVLVGKSQISQVNLIPKVVNNVYYVSVYKKDVIGHCFLTFLSGNLAMAANHCMTGVNKIQFAWTFKKQDDSDFIVDAKDWTVQSFPDSDFCFVTFKPGVIPPQKDLRHLRNDDLDLTGTILHKLDFTIDKDCTYPIIHSSTRVTGAQKMQTDKAGIIEVYIAGGIPNMVSDCGLPYLVEKDNKIYIVGMHNAGNSGGCAVARIPPWPKQTGESQVFSEPTFNKTYEKNYEWAQPTVYDTRGLRNEYEIKKKDTNTSFQYSVGMKTNLVASPIAKGLLVDGKFTKADYPIQKVPANTVPKDGFDPIEEAKTRFHGRITFPLVNPITGDYIDPYDDRYWEGIHHENFRWDRVRPLSLSESINGVSDYLHIGPVDRTTSSGFGFKEFQISSEQLFPIVEKTPSYQKLGVCDELRELVEREEALSEEGMIVPDISITTAKDELREIGKENKPRLFQNAKKSTMIRTKMNLATYFSEVMTHDGCGDIYIGIDPHGVDWRRLYIKLKSMGDDINALDVEAWDMNFRYYFGWIFAEKVRICLGLSHHNPWIRRIRSCIIGMLCGYTIIKDKVYRALMMHSGHFSTAILNSIFNSFMQRTMWYVVNPDVPYNTKCALAVFGDDLAESIARDFINVWNAQVCAKLRKQMFGMNSTTSRKDGKEIAISQPIEEVEFLKRSFVRTPEGIMPALNEKSINAMLMYVHHNKDRTITDRLLCAQNINTALMEFSYFGREYFEKQFEKLVPMLVAMGFAAPSKNYDDHIFNYYH